MLEPSYMSSDAASSARTAVVRPTSIARTTNSTPVRHLGSARIAGSSFRVPLAQERGGYGVGEHLVPERVEVQVVSFVDARQQSLDVGGITGHGVEVDDGVELVARTDPPVDRLPGRFPVTGRVAVQGVAGERQQGRAVDADVLGVRAGDDLLVRVDQVLGDLPLRAVGGFG